MYIKYYYSILFLLGKKIPVYFNSFIFEIKTIVFMVRLRILRFIRLKKRATGWIEQPIKNLDFHVIPLYYVAFIERKIIKI